MMHTYAAEDRPGDRVTQQAEAEAIGRSSARYSTTTAVLAM